MLASNAGAWGDVIKNEFGRLVPCNDTKQTEKVLNELLNFEQNELESMGRNARMEVEKNFSIEKEARRLVDFYRFMQNRVK